MNADKSSYLFIVVAAPMYCGSLGPRESRRERASCRSRGPCKVGGLLAVRHGLQPENRPKCVSVRLLAFDNPAKPGWLENGRSGSRILPESRPPRESRHSLPGAGNGRRVRHTPSRRSSESRPPRNPELHPPMRRRSLRWVLRRQGEHWCR